MATVVAKIAAVLAASASAAAVAAAMTAATSLRLSAAVYGTEGDENSTGCRTTETDALGLNSEMSILGLNCKSSPSQRVFLSGLLSS